jgi:class 3 adenylate cyclase
MDDVRAVMDAADCESAALFGISEGGAMSMLFAATYPERTRAAVRCASAIVERVRPLGLDVRGGLHTDEIEIQRDDIGGIAVHIAARVAGLAGTGEVLVFNTVRDLVAGSGLRFHDRGSHPLKGLPEPLRLFAAEA